MKILYLHGIGSGAESRTPSELRKAFPEAEILSPELPVSPKETFEFLKDYWCSDDIDLIIGTSLGGFYALTIPMVKKLIINPAMFADDDIKNGLGYGPQSFWCVRSDGSKEYIIDETFINELTEIRKHIYEKQRDEMSPDRLDHNLLNETFALFGERDELLHHYDDFCSLFMKDRAYKFAVEHRLSTNEIHEVLVPLIKKVLAEEVPYSFIMDDMFLE